MAVIQHAELLLVFFDFCELAIGRWYNLATAYGFLPPCFHPRLSMRLFGAGVGGAMKQRQPRKATPLWVWFALALVACGIAADAAGYLSLRK